MDIYACIICSSIIEHASITYACATHAYAHACATYTSTTEITCKEVLPHASA